MPREGGGEFLSSEHTEVRFTIRALFATTSRMNGNDSTNRIHLR